MSESATAQAPATGQPATDIDFSNPMVVAQIEARAFQLAGERNAAAIQSVPSVMVDRTSVAEYRPSLDEVTVQFLRFSLVGQTSYMRGQTAGFPSLQARRLVATGHATIVHMHEPPITARRGRT